MTNAAVDILDHTNHPIKYSKKAYDGMLQYFQNISLSNESFFTYWNLRSYQPERSLLP